MTQNRPFATLTGKPLAALVLAVTGFAGLSAAQGIELKATGGVLGSPVAYEINGGAPSGSFLFLSSLKRDTIPLSWLDPSEIRTLGVGLDLMPLWLTSQLDGSGKASFSFTLPNDPVLAGRALLHQALTYPGKPKVFDQFSNITVTPMDTGSAFVAETQNMSVARAFGTSIDLPDGRVMIVGGGAGTLLWQNGADTTEIYDPATRSFSAGPKMTAPRSSHTQTLLNDGRYLLCGGVDDVNVPTKTCEIYDPTTKTFTAVPGMTSPRTFHSASLLPNGRVLIIGGLTDMSNGTNAVTSMTKTTEIYDPGTNSWTAGPRMRTARGAHATADLGNGKIMVVGGLSFTTLFIFKVPNIQTSCEIYNAATNSFSSTGSMATTRALPGQFSLDNGKVLVAGGLTGDITNGGIGTDLCELYNPTTGTWAAAAPLRNKLALPASMRFISGEYAVIAGGANTLYFPHPSTKMETYDSVTNAWTELPQTLQVGRSAGITVQLASGAIAVFGGGTTNSATAVASHEILVR